MQRLHGLIYPAINVVTMVVVVVVLSVVSFFHMEPDNSVTVGK